MTDEPTTLWGLRNKYKKMTETFGSWGFDSPLIWHGLLLTFATIYNPDQEYFYDNLWADMVLNGGDPGEDSIYATVDLFTWRGYIEICLINIITWAFVY